MYSDIAKEKEFMDITVKDKYVVGHFYHQDFRRCKIMDTHLEVNRKVSFFLLLIILFRNWQRNIIIQDL